MAAHSQSLAARATRRHGQGNRALGSRNIHFATEHCLGDRDGHTGNQVVANALVIGVRCHLHRDQDVSRCTAFRRRFSLATEADLFAVLDPRRNLDIQCLDFAVLPADGDLCFSARYRRAKGDLQLMLQVGSPLRFLSTLAATTAGELAK